MSAANDSAAQASAASYQTDEVTTSVGTVTTSDVGLGTVTASTPSDPTQSATTRNLSVVTDNTSPKRVAINDGDMMLVYRSADAVQELQMRLGAELERHLNAVAQLKKELEGARTGHEQLVGVLANQYLKQPGKFSLHIEERAFIETR